MFCRTGSDDGSEHRKFGRTYDMESDAPYRNPIYDNRAFPRPLPVTYKGEWHNDDGYGHDPYQPYIAQSHLETFAADNEEYTPRGNRRYPHHEWYAT